MLGNQVSEEVAAAEPEHAFLHSSIQQLLRLEIVKLSLGETLLQVADLAAQAAGADGTSLRVLDPNRADAVVNTSPLVATVTAIERRLGEGPQITSINSGRTTSSGALGSDRRWQHFGSRAARLGVRSALSLPLIDEQGVFGAISMYALAEDAFDQQATRRGSLFTELAATVLGNAQVLASLKSHNERLHAALNNRAPIDQAIGILMCRTGISPQEAFDRLKKISQNEHQKVHRVAATFVEQARRAATRPSRNDQVTAR